MRRWVLSQGTEPSEAFVEASDGTAPAWPASTPWLGWEQSIEVAPVAELVEALEVLRAKIDFVLAEVLRDAKGPEAP